MFDPYFNASPLSIASQGAPLNGATLVTGILNYFAEGTWTPVFDAAGSSPTVAYTSRIGWWQRLGQNVWISGDVEWSGYTGGSGSCGVSNFPFLVDTTYTDNLAISAGSFTLNASQTNVALQASTSNFLAIIQSGSGVALASLTLPATFAGKLRFSARYRTTSL